MDYMEYTSLSVTLKFSPWMYAFGRIGIVVVQAALVVDIDAGRDMKERLFAFQVSRRML